MFGFSVLECVLECEVVFGWCVEFEAELVDVCYVDG